MTKDGDRTPIISGCANYLFIHFFLSSYMYVNTLILLYVIKDQRTCLKMPWMAVFKMTWDIRSYKSADKNWWLVTSVFCRMLMLQPRYCTACCTAQPKQRQFTVLSSPLVLLFDTELKWLLVRGFLEHTEFSEHKRLPSRAYLQSGFLFQGKNLQMLF